jgi:tetratricopeptide (TPR) repeat protein
MIADPVLAGVLNSAYRSAPTHILLFENNWENMAEAQKKDAKEIKSNSSNLIFGLIGLVLGFVVGFMVTTSINHKQAVQEKAATAQGGEKVSADHAAQPGDIEKVLAEAVEFGKQNQDYESQLRVGSFIYAEARRYEQAKPYLLKAHELKPQEFDPISQLGNLHFDWSQESNDSKLMVEAADWYQKALQIKPDDVNVRTDLGITYHLRQPPDFKAAIAEYDKALALEPKHPPTIYNKARAFIGLKDFKAAEDLYAKLKELNAQQELLTALRGEIDKASGTLSPPVAEAEKAKATGEAVKIPTH